MATGHTGGTPVTERVNRSVTGGCLIFLVLLVFICGCLVAAFWYRLWSTGNTTDMKQAAAEAELRDRTDHAAQESTRALRESATTDPATLTALIWKHTEAPVITYDAPRKEFTAVVEMTTAYDTVHPLANGVGRIVSCDVFKYTLSPDRAWRVDVTTQEAAVCRPGKQIGNLARTATQVLESLDGDLRTITEAQRVLDHARSSGRLTVRKVAQDKHTTTVSALLTDADGTANQCYLLTMARPRNETPGPATATPTNSC